MTGGAAMGLIPEEDRDAGAVDAIIAIPRGLWRCTDEGLSPLMVVVSSDPPPLPKPQILDTFIKPAAQTDADGDDTEVVDEGELLGCSKVPVSANRRRSYCCRISSL